MNDIKIGMAFLLVGFAFWVCGCGASFDDSAEELGLVFDNPADGGRPSPSFQNDIHPILTSGARSQVATLPMGRTTSISGVSRPFKRAENTRR